jgi:hypothetical protein
LAAIHDYSLHSELRGHRVPRGIVAQKSGEFSAKVLNQSSFQLELPIAHSALNGNVTKADIAKFLI